MNKFSYSVSNEDYKEKVLHRRQIICNKLYSAIYPGSCYNKKNVTHGDERLLK